MTCSNSTNNTKPQQIPAMFKLLSLSCLLFIGCIKGMAQTAQPCGTSEANSRWLTEDSSFRKSLERYEQKILQYKKAQEAGTPSTEASVVYTIPVVVHVIHLGEPIGTGTNLSDAVIQQAIVGINKRFRNQIGNGSTDMEVEFCLAKIDPNGATTTGINRVNGSGVSMYASGGISVGSGCASADEIAIKNLSRWPNNDYYNIWVVKDICNGAASGYAYYPGAPPSVDGTVVTYSYFNYNQKTPAHELGHGFGLYHTFEGDNGGSVCPTNTSCATTGDNCCDIPPHKRNDCSATNPCTGAGVWNNALFNHMSYCNFSWPDMVNYGRFTENQKTRVQSSIVSGVRLSLSTSGKCGPIMPPVCTPENDHCSTAVLLKDTNVSIYTNGSVNCATNDGTLPRSGCDITSPTQLGVFYKFVAAGTSTTILVEPFTTGSSGLNAVIAVYSGTSCNNLTEIDCSPAPGYTYTGVNLTGLVTGQTYWVRVYHSGPSQPASGQGGFRICVRKGLSTTCNTPVANVPNASGTDIVTMVCNTSGGIGESIKYKWYKGVGCGGTVVGTDSVYAATQSGYYACKAYIEGFELTCNSCDPGYATIDYSCTSPALTVNDTSGMDSVLLRAVVPEGTNVLYRWYKDSICSGNVVGIDSVYLARTSGYYACMAYVDGYDFACYSCDKAYATITYPCSNPLLTVDNVAGLDSVKLTAIVQGGSNILYKWYSDSSCKGNTIGTGPEFITKTSGIYSCKAYVKGYEAECNSCDNGYAKVTPFAGSIVLTDSAVYNVCSASFFDAGNLTGNYKNNQSAVIKVIPPVAGSKISVTFDSFSTQTHYRDANDTSKLRSDILYVYNGSTTAADMIGALQGKMGKGTITSTATDGSLTFKFISYKPLPIADTLSRSGWAATISCNAIPEDITMIASGSYARCTGNFYDGGGPSGDYMYDQKNVGSQGGVVTSIHPAVPGKQVSVKFNSFATLAKYSDRFNINQLNDDALYVYDGKDTQSPLIGKFTGNDSLGTLVSTSADGSLTFKFVSATPYHTPPANARAGWWGVLGCADPINGLQESTQQHTLLVYPNPANNVLYIASKDMLSEDLLKMSLTNILGQTMLSRDVQVKGKQLETAFDIAHLPSGVYFLQIHSEQLNQVFKIQKQ